MVFVSRAVSRGARGEEGAGRERLAQHQPLPHAAGFPVPGVFYWFSSSLQERLRYTLGLLFLLHGTDSFYVPGVAPINFHRNDPVEIKVGSAQMGLLGWLFLCFILVVFFPSNHST